MEEIKVGEYIRTENGKIHKWSKGRTYTGKNRITKHSSNIIDLIECGDYVNGKLIHKVDIRENSAYIYYGNGKTFCDYQIKDIVTKEQYNSMKYIVGG